MMIKKKEKEEEEKNKKKKNMVGNIMRRPGRFGCRMALPGAY
jgi:hypothetical protein